jgi:hypothetical protein
LTRTCHRMNMKTRDTRAMMLFSKRLTFAMTIIERKSSSIQFEFNLLFDSFATDTFDRSHLIVVILPLMNPIESDALQWICPRDFHGIGTEHDNATMLIFMFSSTH